MNGSLDPGSGNARIQMQNICSPDLAKDIHSQSTQDDGDNSTQYEWHIDQMNIPSREVTETLDRMAHKTSNKEASRGVKETRNIESSPLCDFCGHVFAHLKPDLSREGAPRSTGGLWTPDRKIQSTAQFERSATEFTCSFCRLLWNQLDSGERAEPMKDIGEDDILLAPSKLPLIFRVRYPFPEVFKFLNLIPCQDTEVIPLSSVSDSCNSATSWALANFWLQRCTSDHEKCQRQVPIDSKLPTRLVDLGPEARIVRPRLCHSQDLADRPKYATLSHRWGGTIMPMLTLATVHVWTDAIPISDLSSTFREAMEATKRLGMRYLWVDSLCIIQDSEEDWSRESALMGDVYRNSYCSLSAAAGKSDDNQGLFVQRDPRDIYPCVARSTNPLWKGGDCREWYCFPRYLFPQNITQSPLMTRGWVVQEHILAPRILHFAKQQLFWECLELQACESLPGGVLDNKMRRQGKLSVDTSSLRVYGDNTENPYMRVAERQFLWNEVVERFSTTTLTYPDKDKLAALSGIANHIGVKCEYLAGLWRDHLACHLMWGRYAGTAILERPKVYQAPSWSWASVNGRIFTTRVWPQQPEKVIADVLEAHVDLASDNPTGPVKAGYLRLRGCLAPVTVHKWPPRKGYVEIWNYEVREEPSKDDKMQVHPDIDFIGDEASFHFFLITVRSNHDFSVVCGSGDGILLEPTGARKGEFYRRGRFLCGPYFKKEEMRPLLNLFKMSTTTLDPEHFICESDHVEPVYGLPTYEISII